MSKDAVERYGWPTGVLDLVNHPLRSKGWKPCFSEWPNNVNHYEFKLRGHDDLNGIIQKLAAIRCDIVRIILDPGKEPGALGFMTGLPKGNGIAAVFALGSQKIMDEWYLHLPEIEPGVREFGVHRHTKCPKALEPTLTLFVGNRVIDLAQLKVPTHIVVSTSLSDAYRKEHPVDPLVNAMDAFITAHRKKLEADRDAWCSRPSTADGKTHVWRVRSCKLCQSVQGIEALSPPIYSSVDFHQIVGKEWKWQYTGKDYRECSHEWQDSVSSAVPTKISNGQVVLVRKGETYGAFIMKAQSAKPETAEFVWLFGTDAAGGFDANNPKVKWSNDPKSVVNRNGNLMIEFGPFEIWWSGSLGDKGWIYYAKAPGDELAENDLAICVTEERAFDMIRPRDPKWQYRRSPVDGQ